MGRFWGLRRLYRVAKLAMLAIREDFMLRNLGRIRRGNLFGDGWSID